MRLVWYIKCFSCVRVYTDTQPCLQATWDEVTVRGTKPCRLPAPPQKIHLSVGSQTHIQPQRLQVSARLRSCVTNDAAPQKKPLQQNGTEFNITHKQEVQFPSWKNNLTKVLQTSDICQHIHILPLGYDRLKCMLFCDRRKYGVQPFLSLRIVALTCTGLHCVKCLF